MPCSHCGAEKVLARGYCGGCYHRLRQRGTLVRMRGRNIGSCSEPGCPEPSVSKGLCFLHYARSQHPLKTTWKIIRSRYPNDVPDTWQDFETFIADVGERPTRKHQLRRIDNSKAYSTGNIRWIEPVTATDWLSRMSPEDRSAYGHTWALRKKYGLSKADYERMLSDQGGVCAICGNGHGHKRKDDTPARLHVDHCHATGKVRGLLCVTCNRLLGYAKDEPTVLRKAIAYLRHA